MSSIKYSELVANRLKELGFESPVNHESPSVWGPKILLAINSLYQRAIVAEQRSTLLKNKLSDLRWRISALEEKAASE